MKQQGAVYTCVITSSPEAQGFRCQYDTVFDYVQYDAVVFVTSCIAVCAGEVLALQVIPWVFSVFHRMVTIPAVKYAF